MPPSDSLSDRLGKDTIREWERAARRQWKDAEVLRKNERRLAAVYLYGYVAEILIKSAYFRLDKSLDDVIESKDRQEALNKYRDKSPNKPNKKRPFGDSHDFAN